MLGGAPLRSVNVFGGVGNAETYSRSAALVASDREAVPGELPSPGAGSEVGASTSSPGVGASDCVAQAHPRGTHVTRVVSRKRDTGVMGVRKGRRAAMHSPKARRRERSSAVPRRSQGESTMNVRPGARGRRDTSGHGHPRRLALRGWSGRSGSQRCPRRRLPSLRTACGGETCDRERAEVDAGSRGLRREGSACALRLKAYDDPGARGLHRECGPASSPERDQRPHRRGVRGRWKHVREDRDRSVHGRADDDLAAPAPEIEGEAGRGAFGRGDSPTLVSKRACTKARDSRERLAS